MTGTLEAFADSRAMLFMSWYRILITGSRHWSDRDTIEVAVYWASLHANGRVVVVHGAARGADTLAADAARRLGLDVEAHPADWQRFGRSAGHRRNAEMVAAGADICLAFPLGESPGTRGCMALALAAGIPVVDVSLGRLPASEAAS